MKLTIILKIFILLSLLLTNSFAVSKKYYQDKYVASKKLYLGAIMSNDKKKEIEYLKKLIKYGDKLNKDTLKYKRELNKLDKNVVVSKPVKTTFKLKPQHSKIPTKKSKYNIKSVKQTHNTIVIEFTHKINEKYIDFDEKKDRYYHYDIFNIKGNFKDARPTKLEINPINKIIISQVRNNQLRILLKHKKNPKTIYIVHKNKLIIKVLEKAVYKKEKKSTKKVQKPKKEPVKIKKPPKPIKKQNVNKVDSNAFYTTKKVIVIDAGHGGKDAGAVNGRMYEKNIVLNVAKHLRTLLKKKGFTVYLTRYNDKYLKLPNRTKYANRKKADMFISIHANAARKSRASKAHGVETYFLSPARSARAKRVAALENKGDIKKMGWSSKNSLLTILNQSKITASNKMAIDIQKNMLYYLRNKYGKRAIKDGGVREGPFWVLVGAQMPSILVEVGYISHPREGRRINTRTYQKLVAKGIAQGVESYFIKNRY